MHPSLAGQLLIAFGTILLLLQGSAAAPPLERGGPPPPSVLKMRNLQQVTRDEVIRREQHHGEAKRQNGASPLPSVCGSTSAFLVQYNNAVGEFMDNDEINGRYAAILPSTGNGYDYAGLVDTAAAATPFRLDGKCNLVTATGEVATTALGDAGPTGAWSPVYFVEATKQVEWGGDSGSCHIVDGQLQCTFGNVLGMYVCGDYPGTFFTAVANPGGSPEMCSSVSVSVLRI